MAAVRSTDCYPRPVQAPDRADGSGAAANAARVDVLVVTALQDELDAVLELHAPEESQWQEARDLHGFRYHYREIANERGVPFRIAAAWAGEMGESAAAARAQQLIDDLDPTCLAMCGICAGKRGDVFLGDVIVADRVYSYDHGELVAASEGRPA